MRELSPKQLKFANGLLAGKTGEQAYIDAGYSPNGARFSASTLQTKPNVAKYLAAARAQAKKKGENLAERLRKRLTETALAKSSEAELGEYGEDTVYLMTPVQLKAADMLGRMDGMFEKDNAQREKTVLLTVEVPSSPPPSDPIEGHEETR